MRIVWILATFPIVFPAAIILALTRGDGAAIAFTASVSRIKYNRDPFGPHEVEVN